jgi:FtsH-binding integral membrane protein
MGVLSKISSRIIAIALLVFGVFWLCAKMFIEIKNNDKGQKEIYTILREGLLYISLILIALILMIMENNVCWLAISALAINGALASLLEYRKKKDSSSLISVISSFLIFIFGIILFIIKLW